MAESLLRPTQETAAAAALAAAVETLSVPQRVGACIRGASVERQGQWIVIRLAVTHDRYHQIRLRLGEYAAQEVLDKLGAVLRDKMRPRPVRRKGFDARRA